MPAMPCTAMMHATDIRAHSSDPGKTEWYEVGLEQILKGIWPAFGEISPGPFHRCAKNASTRPSVTASTRANPTRSNWTTLSTSPATRGSQNPSTSPSCV
ncbi:hypothetical protein MBBA_0850 [Methanoculleus bourgensis]|jgi:hypothetical protein|nr:hypothetical protein MBBA_0850 [Methanoculleus bourgensis]